VAIALLVLPWVVALVLVRRHHHLDGAAVGILVAVSLGLPTLWVTWAAYRGSRRAGTSATGLTLAQVANQLAMAVGAQWTAEAAIRRLNDPYPLPVSWDAADASLTDPWDALVKLATSGAGWPEPPPAGTWAAAPEELAGEGGELAEVLALVPTGRLVVLGGPGSGKTMLMVRLVLDLLARRASGGPVPILASVASWDPASQDLPGWLGTQLVVDYPALASAPPAGREEPTQADALLASGLILPVLDGLDEISEQVRGPAISRINDALRPGQPLVVTCRTQQYRDVVRPQGDLEVTLRAAAAVQVRPLDADTVRDYLSDDAAGPAAKARWASVLAVLGTEAPAAQALSTPLMVGLARAIYNPRPGELAGTLRDPAELCSPNLPDRKAVESLLFDVFIPAAYRNDPSGRWKAQDAEKWLVFLACHLEYKIASPDLAWWQLNDDGTTALAPARGMKIDVEAFAVGLGLGTAVGLGIGLGVGLRIGLAAGLGTGLLVVCAVGFGGAPGDLARVTSPGAALARDRQAALLLWIVSGLLAGIAASLVTGLVGVGLGVGSGLGIGIGGALGGGGVVSSGETAWPSYTLTRGRLALRRRLPWSLMSFLADAHRRGALRQAGAVYQFRHIELQHRLANRDTEKEKRRRPA
jgi:hypothetical protein